MTNWVINLGFDKDTVSPSTALQWGVTTPQGTAGFISMFKPGDTFGFVIFNITSSANEPVTTPPLSDFSVTSAAALFGQDGKNPWGSNDTPFPSHAHGAWTTRASGVFPGGPFSSMTINTSGNTAALEVPATNSGQFAIGISFVVTHDNQPTLFGVDPVMIVTSG